MSGIPISDLAVGRIAEVSKSYGEWDIFIFAAVTGDINPAHTDEAFAEATPFRGRVAHGMLTSSLVSAVLGTQLPGPGTIYLSQELKFRRPVRIGDTITARAEVTELQQEKNIARLKTTCVNQRGETVLDGEAVVMPPKQPIAAPSCIPREAALATPPRFGVVVGQRMSPRPVSIGPSTSLAEARALLHAHRIRHLVVLEGERLVGIITDRDIRQASLPRPPDQPHFNGDPMMDLVRTGQAMTKEVITVTPDTPLEHAATLMILHRIGGLPVVEDERVVGIITETDILGAFLEHTGPVAAPPSGKGTGPLAAPLVPPSNGNPT